MKALPTFAFFAALTLCGWQGAAACDFHGAGFAPYGSKWQSYYPDDPRTEYYEDEVSGALNNPNDDALATADVKLKPAARARPTFASASIRASNSAKARLGQSKFLRSVGVGALDLTSQSAQLKADR